MIGTLTKQPGGKNNLPYLLVGRKPNLNSDWIIHYIEAVK
tara:strand:+ start:419 stop:538 length:120 start_codon:yes stop_codon:yes gene_type:complete